MALRDALSLLAAAWPQTLSREQAAIYAEMLADIDADELVAAIRQLIATDEYRPAVARIRSAVIDSRGLLPSETVAVAQAAALADWESQHRVPLGARNPATLPARPDVHPTVAAAYTAVGTTHMPSFIRAWRAARDEASSALAIAPLDRPALPAPEPRP